MANGLDGDQAQTLRRPRRRAQLNRTEPQRMNFFSRGSGSKTKQPPDLVRALKDAVLRLESSQTGPEQKRKVSPCSPQKPSWCCCSAAAPRVGDGRTSLSAPTHLLEDTQASTQRLTMLTRMPIPLQASEDVSKYLFQMKVLLYGDGGEASSSQETLLETLMADFFSLVA